jgi:hypothetical protein
MNSEMNSPLQTTARATQNKPWKVIYHAIVETSHLSGVLRVTLALDRGILVEPVTVNGGAEQ